jgi:hypothetical protein
MKHVILSRGELVPRAEQADKSPEELYATREERIGDAIALRVPDGFRTSSDGNGGYILTHMPLDEAKPANVMAMFDFTNEYWVYT